MTALFSTAKRGQMSNGPVEKWLNILSVPCSSSRIKSLHGLIWKKMFKIYISERRKLYSVVANCGLWAKSSLLPVW